MLLIMFGLNEYIFIIDFLKEHLDEVYSSIEIIIGTIITLYGLFNEKIKINRNENVQI